MARKKRVDVNQKEIVQQLRDLGFVVEVLSYVGNGFPDILVGGYSVTEDKDTGVFVELKSGERKPVTDAQVVFHEKWGNYIPLIKVHTLEEILDFFGRIDENSL